MIVGTAESEASSVSVDVCVGLVCVCEGSLGGGWDSLGGGVCETEIDGGRAGTGGGGAESDGGGNL